VVRIKNSWGTNGRASILWHVSIVRRNRGGPCSWAMRIASADARIAAGGGHEGDPGFQATGLELQASFRMNRESRSAGVACER
jgi:hypothetical protein